MERSQLPGEALLRRGGPRLFATPADEPRARRASDVTALVAAALALATISFAAVPVPGFARSVSVFLDAIPGIFDSAWQVLADLLVVLAVVMAVVTLVRRRWSIARDLLVSIVMAFVVWLVVGRVVEGSWPAIWDSLSASDPPPWYPSPRIAVCAAVVLTVSPHLARPVRRLATWVVAGAALAVAVLGATMPLGAIAGWLVAVIAAAAVHLAFGSSAGRPGLGLVRAALAELGVPTTSVGAADRQQTGLFVVDAIDERGDALLVKVYGRDAHDAALLSTLWRTVWFREAGSPLRFGRLQQVEHEAFLTLFAGQAGLLTDRVVTAGATADDDALLVLARRGVLLADDDARRGDPSVVAQLWELVRRLHGAGVAHGQLDDRHVLVDGDQLGLVGFRGATVAATATQRRIDEVQALVTTADLVGVDAATAAALNAVGPDELTAMLPYVQPTTLTALQRRRVGNGGLDLDELRASAAEAAGTPAPALVQLRRVTLGSIVRVVLPAFAVVALISGLAGLDLAELGNQLGDATW